MRIARADEREALENLQRRASLAISAYREQLMANPDAVELPLEQVVRGDVIVAEVNGRIAGFAALDGGELDGLFVEPSLWRQGIGTALAEAATHRARRAGLSLFVVASPSARGFYESCGFSGEVEVPTRFGPAIRMSR